MCTGGVRALSFLTSPLCLLRRTLTNPGPQDWLSSTLGLQTYAATLGFYVRVRDLISGPPLSLHPSPLSTPANVLIVCFIQRGANAARLTLNFCFHLQSTGFSVYYFLTMFSYKAFPTFEIMNKALLQKNSPLWCGALHGVACTLGTLVVSSVHGVPPRPFALRPRPQHLYPASSTHLSLPRSFSFFMSTMPPVAIWKGSSCRKHTAVQLV